MKRIVNKNGKRVVDYYATHREESSKRSKKHRKAYLDKMRESKYGVTPEQYAQMLKDQNGVCAICGKKPTKRALGVDHDHTTGAVRGLLCMKCNLLVGYVECDLSNLHKAIEYVESHAKLV